MAIIEDKSLKRSHLTQQNEAKWGSNCEQKTVDRQNWANVSMRRRHVNVRRWWEWEWERGRLHVGKSVYIMMVDVDVSVLVRCASIYEYIRSKWYAMGERRRWKLHRSVSSEWKSDFMFQSHYQWANTASSTAMFLIKWAPESEGEKGDFDSVKNEQLRNWLVVAFI